MRASTLYERVHVLHGGYKMIRLKSGREITFSDARSGAEGALSALYTWTSRMGKLARDYVNETDWLGRDFTEYDFDWEQIERHIDHVEDLIRVWRTQIQKHQKRRSKQLQIIALRNVEGRDPEEAAMFLAKADELERALEAGDQS